ncbi:MAG: phosphoribosyl-ATP diphosphatase [Gammaproteobacteria bacterium]|nr:phosphoribosyl-ATP diphosphatase [Gammaproteobacteria bacterium]MDH3434805.1 phosphoribosyl-ATP diphosphatase [Gammaproteobacteria bacterium]
MSDNEGNALSNNNCEFLATLEGIIQNRLSNPVAGSYTNSLLAAGPKRMAQKVGEEGVELAIAAVTGERDEMLNEAADLLYHMLVLLSSQHITLNEVSATLEARHAD